MHKIFEILHVAPLFLIIALYAISIISNSLRSKYYNLRSYIAKHQDKITSIQLALAAVGVAFGTNCHTHHHEGTLYLIDPCFLYSAVILLSAKNIVNSKKSKVMINVKSAK